MRQIGVAAIQLFQTVTSGGINPVSGSPQVQVAASKELKNMTDVPFWESKSLDEMSDLEWESLCDGCGQCCLHKLVNDDTGDVFYTRVACRLLNPESGRCGRYAQRLEIVEDCLNVRQMRDAELSWMPRTCAYRRLAEGKPLPNWHPLLTGTSDSVRTAGLSIAGRTISEQAAKLDDLEVEIIDWVEI